MCVHAPTRALSKHRHPNVKRRFVLWLFNALLLASFSEHGQAQAQDLRSTDLTLYGIKLKNAQADAFIAAAKAAGVRPLASVGGGAGGMVQEFDARSAGVPALLRLSLTTQDSRLITARFVIKGYGQDNQALRSMLAEKYGVPTLVDRRSRPYPAFADRTAPRGLFEWEFAQGMKLLYEQPRLGDPSLSYTDASIGDGAAGGTGPVAPGTELPPEELNRRF
jgi:hypothetical protein